MKIGLIVPEMPPDTIGGGGAVFEALAANLFERKHDVRVVTSHTYGGPRADAFPYPTVRLSEFPHPAPAYRTYMPPYPHELLRARHLLQDCDVVNAHGHGHPLVDLVSRLWVPPHKTVYTLHGFLYTIPKRGGPLAKGYALYDRAFGKRLFRRSRYLTAVSRAVADVATLRGRPDTMVINNGFDALSFEADISPNALMEMQKGPYILCVGRLEWLKGFDIVLRSLASLRESGVPLRLLLAGRDNGAERELRTMAQALKIEQAVSFLGFIPHASLAHLYHQATIFCLSSRTEAFPAAPLEAMSVGVACVLARIGGVSDIATDEADSLLFAPEDAGELTDKLQRVWRDEGLRVRIARAGTVTSRRFSWQRVADMYEDLFIKTARGA